MSSRVSDSTARQDTGRFRRLILPGLVFKAVVIGGGYATGRELVEFFAPAGPMDGLCGMLLAMLIWSAVCMIAFALAVTLRAFEYRALFRALLGPAWSVFELCYLAFLILILAVMSAAAGAIGAALFGLPLVVGTLALMLLKTKEAAPCMQEHPARPTLTESVSRRLLMPQSPRR